METRDAVIIGSGAVGLAVAAALAEAGVRDIVVFDRLPGPGQGSTSRANGGVRAQFTTAANVHFSRISLGVFEALEREMPGVAGYVRAGYLLMTGTARGEATLRQGAALQRALGVETEWLTPAEVLARAPFVRSDGLRGGTFHGRDGFIDPHGIARALHARAARAGVDFRFDEEVVAAVREATGLFRVRLSSGEFRARWLINAAGPDAREVALLLGVDLPVHPVRRNLACTAPVSSIPPLIPMCVDTDTGVLIRRESGGVLIAWSDPADPPGRDTSVDPHFLEGVAARVGHRFPFLSDVPIDPRHCWAGLYPETPDHHAIVGETPGVPGFLQAVGFGGHGIMHAPAAGIALAEIVTRGRSETLDLHPLRAARFAEGDLVKEAAVL